MARSLSGKTILITGASAGIGHATALACGRAGMNVVVTARREERLAEVVGAIEAAGGQGLAVPGDVQDDAHVRDAFEQAEQTFGSIDAVFANAGYGLFCPVADMTDTDMRDMYETNVFGTVRVIQEAVPRFRRQGHGHVLICTSSCSEVGLPMYGFYSSTKAAQDSLAGALRAEVADDGIHVSTVHPIGTDTEFFEVVKDRSDLPRVGYNTPASLMHSSEKVADAVIKCLRRPRPEVWPGLLGLGVRFGLAISTAFPRLAAWSMRRMVRQRYAGQSAAKPTESESSPAQPATESSAS
ncbi:MAG: SDR family NAD(P)-dependent oxidoreductase [Phycisphaeraceae bacterium]|nr:SDR family NAD(P)-dependent oxidoreductase [Phycisphaeraceae bacterium]